MPANISDHDQNERTQYPGGIKAISLGLREVRTRPHGIDQTTMHPGAGASKFWRFRCLGLFDHVRLSLPLPRLLSGFETLLDGLKTVLLWPFQPLEKKTPPHLPGNISHKTFLCLSFLCLD